MNRVDDNGTKRNSTPTEDLEIAKKVGGAEYTLIAETEITEDKNQLLKYETDNPIYDDFLVIAENIVGTNGTEFKVNFTIGDNNKYYTLTNAVSSTTARRYIVEFVRKANEIYRWIKGGYITGQVTDYIELSPTPLEEKIKQITIYVKYGDIVNQGKVRLFGRKRF